MTQIDRKREEEEERECNGNDKQNVLIEKRRRNFRSAVFTYDKFYPDESVSSPSSEFSGLSPRKTSITFEPAVSQLLPSILFYRVEYVNCICSKFIFVRIFNYN